MKVKTKEEWKSLVEKLQASGLTKSEFCRRNQIGSGQFYVWVKSYGDGVIPSTPITGKVRKPKQSPSKFIEIELEKPGGHSKDAVAKTVRIMTSYGAVVEIPL